MAVIFANSSNGIIYNCIEHNHPYTEIIFTTHGGSLVSINGENIEVIKGTVLLIPPQMSHYNKSEGGFSDISILVDDVIPELISDKPFLFLDSTNDMAILAEMIYRNYIEKEFNYKAINQKLLDSIYEHLIRLKGTKYIYDFVRKLKDLMTENLGNSAFDISKESKGLGVSFDYMRHCFKEEFNMTPLAYLTELRIRHAKRLLAHNIPYKISEIASMCGYADQYYFSKTFKKLTGVSPKEYRQLKNSHK